MLTIPLAAYGHRTDLGRLRFKWLNPEKNDAPEFYNLEKWFSNGGYAVINFPLMHFLLELLRK